MYTVIGLAKTRAFRVIWALEELGQPYEYNAAYPRSEEVLKHSPLGKVPVLLTDEGAVTDSTAILTYLADRHATLIAPAGTLARAHQDSMMHRVLDELDAVLWTAARHSFVLPEEKRVPEVKLSLNWEFANNIARIAEHMDTEFAAGDEFTIVDIVLTHCLNWAHAAKFEHESEKMTAYAKTMRARAAFRKAAELI